MVQIEMHLQTFAFVLSEPEEVIEEAEEVIEISEEETSGGVWTRYTS